jgi:hypothetical protein
MKKGGGFHPAFLFVHLPGRLAADGHCLWLEPDPFGYGKAAIADPLNPALAQQGAKGPQTVFAREVL